MQRPLYFVGRARSLDKGHSLDEDDDDMIDTHCIGEREAQGESAFRRIRARSIIE